MTEKCFNRSKKTANGRCGFCAKNYCADCLLMTGEFKAMVCKNCYEVFTKKYTQSIKRRKIFNVIAVVLLIPTILLFLFAKDGLNFTYLMAAILFTFTITINFIMIKKMRKFLVSEKYKK